MVKYYSFTYKVNIGLYTFEGYGCYKNELGSFDNSVVSANICVRYNSTNATITSYKEITKEEFNVLLRKTRTR